MASEITSKDAVRSAMLDRRRRLDTETCEDAARVVCRQVLAQPEVFQSLNVGLYWAFQKELPTEGLFLALRRQGKRVYLPRMLAKGQELEFVSVLEEAQLREGPFGILEPDLNLSQVPLSQIEVMIIPGVAFDLAGHRIGWGKGMYDRVLEKFSGKRIGLAYDFQVYEKIPFEKRDEAVDKVVTERRVIQCKKE